MSENKKEEPKLLLRSYKATDQQAVDELYHSVYYNLVPQGVKSKLKSPGFWIGWFGVYAYLLRLIPVLMYLTQAPLWAFSVLKLVFTVSWFIVAFIGIFVLTERFEIGEKIEVARANDFADPESYYIKGEPKKKQVKFDPSASHFWIMRLDGQLCGMVGLDQRQDPFISKRRTQPPIWKVLIHTVLTKYHLPLPESFKDLYEKMPYPVFAEAHDEKVATLQRWAVGVDFRNCNVSTLLINRAMSWADEKGIERVEAKTNELETIAADILKENGFKMVNKKNTGYLGQYEKTWSCDVKQWMETHEEGAKTYRR